MLDWIAIRLFFCPPPFQPSQCLVQIVVMLCCSMLEINDVVLYCIVLYCKICIIEYTHNVCFVMKGNCEDTVTHRTLVGCYLFKVIP